MSKRGNTFDRQLDTMAQHIAEEANEYLITWPKVPVPENPPRYIAVKNKEQA